MNTLKSRHHEQGFVLLVVYLVVVLISIFSFALFARSNAFAQASERNLNKMAAFNMAESGADWALRQLATDPNYTGTPAYVSMSTNFVRGGFIVTVTTPADNPAIRIIQAAGFAPDNNTASRAYQTSAVTAYGQYSPGKLFNFAIFAENSITLTGNDKTASVDSYDSRTGPYVEGGTNGDIGVNSIAAGSITLNGKTIVQGDALVGSTGDPASGIDVGPNATITGTSGTLTETQVYSDPTTSLPSSGDLAITGGTTTLMPGTYHYDSLSITGTGALSLTGPVIIYVDGSVEIAGNGVATSGDLPTNLLIYVTGSETVKIDGNGSFFGGIYAPNSLVKNDGNGGLFGAVVSKDYVQTGNARIHFDQAMSEIESDEALGDLELEAWQEQNSLTWGT